MKGPADGSSPQRVGALSPSNSTTAVPSQGQPPLAELGLERGADHQTRGTADLDIAGVAFVADPAGVLYWPERRLLAVADLHLEKGSSFARRGVPLPPYDTAATLARLAWLMARYVPRVVVALGDSFHDQGGPARIADTDRAMLGALQRGRDWIWIAGNHDPEPDRCCRRRLCAGAGSRPGRVPACAAAQFIATASWPAIFTRWPASATRTHDQPALLCRRRDGAW